MPTKELFGRYLDQFEVGEIIEHWPARTVTEADDLMFCMLTMNHHPLPKLRVLRVLQVGIISLS